MERIRVDISADSKRRLDILVHFTTIDGKDATNSALLEIAISDLFSKAFESASASSNKALLEIMEKAMPDDQKKQ